MGAASNLTLGYRELASLHRTRDKFRELSVMSPNRRAKTQIFGRRKTVANFIRKLAFQVTACCLLLLGSVTFASAENRIALVIGNSAYTSVSALDNPTRDARLIAETLETLDFQVTLLIDATLSDMNTALRDFGRSLRAGGQETTGLFYYAGHGVQSFGNNYLLPVDATLENAADLDLQGVEAQSVLRQMASARNKANFVILDACRNNPFADKADFDAPGLAEMKAPRGTFLSYATEPGSVALDGTGENSPFTQALAREMTKPGVPVEQMFKQVRNAVLEETNNLQTPWDTSSLTIDFAFVDAPEENPVDLAERQLWTSVQSTRDPVQIMLFLRGYPNSIYNTEARALLLEVMEAELTDSAPARPATVPTGPSESEQALFEALQAHPTIEGYRDFLVNFPNGTFSEFAKEELAALEAKTNFDPVGEGVTGTAKAEEPQQMALADQTRATAGPVKFDLPMVAPGSVLDGVRLSNLFDMSPEFPPIPDLPEQYWKNETCSACHQWTRERLCEQSNVYLNLGAQPAMEKQHPFGGVLKRNLRQWAAGGCE